LDVTDRKGLLVLLQTWRCHEQGQLENIIDADLEDDLDAEEACRFLKVGLLCTQDAMKLRPNMTNIVRMLTGEKSVSTEKITKPAVISNMGDIKVNNQEGQGDSHSPTMRSFTITEPSTIVSSEASIESLVREVHI
jgi:hypothetical protein